MKLRAAMIVGAVLIAPPAIARSKAADDEYRVADIQARFLYEQSGTLSEDITDNPDFTAWNSVIGEGAASENANDLLVTVRVDGPRQINLATPLVVTVRDDKGRRIASRRVEGMLAEEATHRSLLLYDVGCAGVLKIEARLGVSVRNEEIDLPCGE